MAGANAEAATIGGIGLLERAINYTLGSLRLVGPEHLGAATPCAEWDLRALLYHMEDSLAALSEVIGVGRLALDTLPWAVLDAQLDPAFPVEVVGRLRDRACQLIGAWVNAPPGRGLVAVGGCPLTTSIVAGTGALEVAVHGWDVARACGARRPIPDALAEELLDLSPLLVTEADRGQFGPAQPVPPGSRPGDRLVAFLGRRP